MEISEFPLTGADGRFEFPSVPAGEWRLDAEAEIGWDNADRSPKMARGSTAAIVEHEDLDDVEVRLRMPFPMNVEIEGEGLRQGVSAAGMLALGPVDGGLFVPPLGKGASVYPGRYRLESVVPGYYVAAVTLGDRDVLGQTIDLASGSATLHVVFKRASSGLRGTVEKGEGASVLVWPQNAAETVTVNQVTCGPNGTFEASGLLPGTYYAAAFDHVVGAELADAAFLRTLAASAVPVQVDDGATSAVQLSVNRWPE
jgi:hypothetical protein